MKLQLTLTVSEAKRIIAKGILVREDVQKALKEGKVLLKGGTTVSAVAEEILGRKLRIGGRISPKGTMNALKKQNQPHCVLIKSGELTDIDANIDEIVTTLGKNDVIIASANAIDIHGGAAMLAAAPLGHIPGKAIAGFMSQGCKVIIAAGLEKLIPTLIHDAVIASGRNTIDKSFGSAVGLIPIVGEVFTEREAIMQLAAVKAVVIAAGGILGAEGATTIVVEGDAPEVDKIFNLVASVKGTELSGIPESLIECERGCPQCRNHLACIYKLGLL
jgi:hypothetical protein